MEKLDETGKISFKEGAYPFYKDFILQTIFTDAQRQEFNQASDAYDNCFLLAKQKKGVESEKAYNECCAIKKKLDPVVAVWVAALCEPRLSYYHYKIGDYQMALVVTEEIIQANQLLQEQGYQYMFFSEMQQVHNLSRIYFTLNKTSDAIAICIKCLVTMYEHSGKWKQGQLINGIPEEYVIADSQYAMIVQVMTETFIRILRTFQFDSVLVYHWLRQFVDPLTEISFALISTDCGYKYIDALVSFLHGMALNNDETDHENLLFVEKMNVDKFLLGVLYEYITFKITENEKALVIVSS